MKKESSQLLGKVNMIPKYLQGKSAAQIIIEMQKRKLRGVEYEQYIMYLEALLLLAVKDALMNADGRKLCNGDYGLMGSEAEGRAIAFLNIILPYEEKKNV